MTASSRRYLSVWLCRLTTDRIARCTPLPVDAALVVAAPVKSALRLCALNEAAARRSLKTGMALADARAMFPDLMVVPADPAADRTLLEAVADWCDRYTPLVALDPPDGIVLDVTGCAHLFGGEEELVRDLCSRLARQGLHARAAIAQTPAAAFAVAHYGLHPVVSAGETQKAVATLPLAALRLAPDIVERLTQVGLHVIADVIGRPRAPLAARFGAGFIRRLDHVLGHADEPITPRLPLPAMVVEQRFPDPLMLEAGVLAAIGKLAGRLCGLLEQRGEGARLVQAALFRCDGKVYRVDIGTAEPLRDPERLHCLFNDRFSSLPEACDPGFGFDMLRLSVLVPERSEPSQTGWGQSGDERELAHLVDRFGARFGLNRVFRLVAQETHIPEFAVLPVPAHAGAGALQPSPHRFEQESLAPVRPLRLFQRPEPVLAVAEVPDGPPNRFRWRNIWHDVIRAEGPERIAMEWWRDDKARVLTRDYFRIESRSCGRVWLYREGLYERETSQPRWFLHGLFA